MADASSLRDQIEKVEEAYEYMLAYAAQGRADEGAGPDGAHIRIFLGQFAEAVDAIESALGTLPGADDYAAGFIDAVRRDSVTMRSVLAILMKSDNISSESVDNANGLIAARSYLTSLFFIDKSAL